MEKYLLHIAWFLFCLFGSFVDARIWNRKEDDPLWLRKNFDYFWLFGFPTIMLINQSVGYYMHDYFTSPLSMLAYSLFIASGMSVVWDLSYSKIEKGEWIADLRLWLTIPKFWKKSTNEWDDRWIIGFTKTQMYYFNALRILILIISFFI